MKNIVGKTVAFLLCIAIAASVCASCFSVSAEIVALGELRVSKVGGLWEDYQNRLILLPNGSTVTGLYYHKLYAEFDGGVGAYVVKQKVASHRAVTISVKGNAFGLCFNFTPSAAEGRNDALANFETWCKIRVGDLITVSGIDLTKKTIETSGTWGSDFVSNAVMTVKRNASEPTVKTAYYGKTIVALGDSVTSNGGWTESAGDAIGGYIINSGSGGNRTNEALARFERDVAAKDPDVVLIMFGINDVLQYVYDGNTLKTFKNNLIALYQKCDALGAKVVFMTPNNINIDKLATNKHDNYGGLDVCFKQFVEAIREVAREKNAFLIDHYAIWSGLDVLSYVCDTVHPNAAGHDLISKTVSDFLLSHSEELVGAATVKPFELINGDGYENKDGYFRGLSTDMNASAVKKLFKDAILVIGENGAGIADSTVVGTGCAMKASDGSVLTIVIAGDTNGNGNADENDYLSVKLNLKQKLVLSDAKKKAADVNGDGRVTATDYIMIKRNLSGKYKIDYSIS